ncbi:MAG: acyl-CoA dehydrogenase family protein [Acidimicrobiia bacterium]|nr:acyl-CoA dehydrogenase family protein [Acidimicrobiia bacterium]
MALHETEHLDDRSGELAGFRRHVREWLARHAPRPGQRPPPGDEIERLDRARRMQAALHDAGLVGITWPVEWGGRGLTRREQLVVAEESAAYELGTSVFAIGLGMCGPTVLAHGTDAQRRRYLRPLLRGEEIWCQLFSEPGAGSDVASLRTRAVRDGEAWRVDGQKVWTSGAQHCTFGLLLARTDPDVPKHEGLTMFVVDMRAPGVTVRPLRQMSGESHFNEVFLDDVRTDEVVGPIGEGWPVARTTLMNERVSVSGGTTGTGTSADALVRLAQGGDRASDPLVRQALAEVWIREKTLHYVRERVRAAARAGLAPGPEGSVAKLASSDLAQRAASLAVALQGPGALAWDPTDERGERWSRRVCAAPGASIGGGTDEILRNLVGERVLGLPREPAVDRDVPFRDLVQDTRDRTGRPGPPEDPTG